MDLIKNQINEKMNLQKIQSLSNTYNIITMYKIKLIISIFVILVYHRVLNILRESRERSDPFTWRGNEFQSTSQIQLQKNKENEDHLVWSGLGLESGYHYFIDVYNMDEQRILARSDQQNKMDLRVHPR